jgi:hypothetical protein
VLVLREFAERQGLVNRTKDRQANSFERKACSLMTVNRAVNLR